MFPGSIWSNCRKETDANQRKVHLKKQSYVLSYTVSYSILTSSLYGDLIQDK